METCRNLIKAANFNTLMWRIKCVAPYLQSHISYPIDPGRAESGMDNEPRLKRCRACGKCAEQMKKCPTCKERFGIKWLDRCLLSPFLIIPSRKLQARCNCSSLVQVLLRQIVPDCRLAITQAKPRQLEIRKRWGIHSSARRGERRERNDGADFKGSGW